MKQVPAKVVKLATGVLASALLISAFWLLAAISITILNADFNNRSPQSITLRAEKDADKSGVNVKLVSRHASNVGYSLDSLMRASPVVNCQLIRALS